MKKSLISLLGAALIGSALFAQNTVIDSRPAHDGKDLTMEKPSTGAWVTPAATPAG